jgi:hypothetical protein
MAYAEQELIDQLGLDLGVRVYNRLTPSLKGMIIGVSNKQTREGDELVTYTCAVVETTNNGLQEWYVGNCIPV